jgi:hypothetical protein
MGWSRVVGWGEWMRWMYASPLIFLKESFLLSSGRLGLSLSRAGSVVLATRKLVQAEMRGSDQSTTTL